MIQRFSIAGIPGNNKTRSSHPACNLVKIIFARVYKIKYGKDRLTVLRCMHTNIVSMRTLYCCISMLLCRYIASLIETFVYSNWNLVWALRYTSTIDSGLMPVLIHIMFVTLKQRDIKKIYGLAVRQSQWLWYHGKCCSFWSSAIAGIFFYKSPLVLKYPEKSINSMKMFTW